MKAYLLAHCKSLLTYSLQMITHLHTSNRLHHSSLLDSAICSLFQFIIALHCFTKSAQKTCIERSETSNLLYCVTYVYAMHLHVGSKIALKHAYRASKQHVNNVTRQNGDVHYKMFNYTNECHIIQCCTNQCIMFVCSKCNAYK